MYTPLESAFYMDVQLAEIHLVGPDDPAWKAQDIVLLLKNSGAEDDVRNLADALGDGQKKTLLTALRQAAQVAKDKLRVDFWERKYTDQTDPADSDHFVYVREDLPRAIVTTGEITISILFS